MREMDVRAIFTVLLKNLKWVIISAVVGGLLFGAWAALFVNKTYKSDFQIYVSNYSDLESAQSATTGGLTASQSLVQEYIVIIKNDMVLSEISGSLSQKGYTVSNAQLRNAIKMSSANNTAMLNVAVTTTSPKLSKAICDSFVEVVPDKLREIMELGSVKVMAPAKIGTLVGPKIVYDAIFGCVIGLIVACAVIIIIFLTDNTIKDERELKRRLDLIVLGEVPSIQPLKKGEKTNGKKQ